LAADYALRRTILQAEIAGNYVHPQLLDDDISEIRLSSIVPYSWTPCACCTPGREYTCPVPIVLNNNRPFRTATSQFYGHKQCTLCSKSVPFDDQPGASRALAKTKCVACLKTFCGSLAGPCDGQADALVKVDGK